MAHDYHRACVMKFEGHDSSEIKKLYKIVRRDSGADVEGWIISADDAIGECSLQIDSETKTFSFGPHGIRIVPRGRELILPPPSSLGVASLAASQLHVRHSRSR